MFTLYANGLGSGSSMTRLIRSQMNPAVLRPWMEEDAQGNWTGRNFITVHPRKPDGSFFLGNDGKPVQQNILTNAPALLRRNDWLRMDEAVLRAAQPQLRLWGDIYGANPINLANGMGTIALGDTTVTGDAVATISMDPIRRGERTREVYDTRQMPLPFIHSDGSFTARQLAVSQVAGAPLDTGGITRAARAVAVSVEELALGTASSYSFGDGTVYGLLNHPQRFTKTLTSPEAVGWAPQTTVTEVRQMIKTLEDARFTGPYVLYHSNNFGFYFGEDYSETYGGETLLTRLERLPKIRGNIRPLDYLTGYQMILIQLSDDVVQGVNGMGITTVQWEEEGGFEIRYKVLCMMIPRVRKNASNQTGYVHGNV